MPAAKWYPKAVQDPQQDGGSMVATRARGVLHSTESAGYPSYKPGTHPHFTVWADKTGVHVRQHVPLDRASRALMHPAGTGDTNREDAIQIEIATFAAHVDETPPAVMAAVRDLMRWIEAQTGIKRHAPAFKAYPASYGVSNGVRMTAAQWVAFDGWCGHEHVPSNDHGDPGAIDIGYLLSAAPDAGKKPTVATKVVHALVRPKLTVDGDLGPKTILALQSALKTKLTGVLDVATRRALQAHLRVHVDGVLGSQTISALQRHLAVHVDGAWGPDTTKALQRVLNAKTF